ncbi:DUF6090 family protein [Gilvibacter sp.]|uniref:DUF6090 family protein n=1 Tax=Gilvibacter sp. TaxID=2729997 RepID=UPI003B52E864
MLKFFRDIRLKLVRDKRLGNYLIYAFGEIILIVVGILLALQIDAWKQQSDDRATERMLLAELHNEFKANKTQWDTVMHYHRLSLASTEYVYSQLPIDLKTVDLDSLSHHLYYMTWVFTYNPSNGVAKSILNNSTFDVIRNDELRSLLIRWNDMLVDYQEEEVRAFHNFENRLKPYMKKHLLFTSETEKALRDPRIDLNFLTSLEFDNFVMDRYLDLDEILDNMTGELELMENSINRILELSAPEN